MSHFQVAFTKIKEIHPHPNADRLEIATVYGFQVVVQKDKYQVGDFALFVPIDSVLNQDIEGLILGPDPKIKFDKHRVKQIRIRKYPSQGLLVDVSVVKEYLKLKGVLHPDQFCNLEVDLSGILGIHKYEPPLPSFQRNQTQTRKEKPLENPNFHKYNGLENIKWFGDLFKEGEEVVIQEKLHGSNCRAGVLKVVKPKPQHILNELKAFNLRGALVLLAKFVKMTFSKEDVYERVYGSNNVELTNRGVNNSGYYGENVYLKVLDKVKAFEKINPGEIIYGELIGEGIQKNYDYGHKGTHHFVLFDVKIMDGEETRWLTPEEVEVYGKVRGFDVVPRLFTGPYNKQIAYELTKGDSVYCPKQKVREGIVIKAVEYNNKACAGNKKALKWISEKYLDSDQSDNH